MTKFLDVEIDGIYHQVGMNTKHIKSDKPFVIGDRYVLLQDKYFYLIGELVGQLNNYYTKRYYKDITTNPLVFKVIDEFSIKYIVKSNTDNILSLCEFKDYTNNITKQIIRIHR